jgi:hypothetical protein
MHRAVPLRTTGEINPATLRAETEDEITAIPLLLEQL